MGALGDAEPLLALPAVPYPATITVTRTVADNATVAFRGYRSWTPPGLLGAELTLRHRLGTATLEVISPAGTQLATHRLAPDGAGAIVRADQHRAELESAVLQAFTTEPPCDRKGNHPPGPQALAAAAKLLGADGRDVTVDLARYEQLTTTACRPSEEQERSTGSAS